MARVRAQVLPSVLPGIKGETILDIGSGFGTLTMELAKNNPESQVYGIDVHDSLTGQAQMNAEVLGISNRITSYNVCYTKLLRYLSPHAGHAVLRKLRIFCFFRIY